jgi:hypothetical protein
MIASIEGAPSRRVLIRRAIAVAKRRLSTMISDYHKSKTQLSASMQSSSWVASPPCMSNKFERKTDNT